jgi:hypothetical protein
VTLSISIDLAFPQLLSLLLPAGSLSLGSAVVALSRVVEGTSSIVLFRRSTGQPVVLTSARNFFDEKWPNLGDHITQPARHYVDEETIVGKVKLLFFLFVGAFNLY